MSKALRMVDPGVKGFEPRGPKLSRDQMMTEFHKPTDKRVFAIAQVQCSGYSCILLIHRFTRALTYTVNTPILAIHPCNPPYPHHNSFIPSIHLRVFTFQALETGEISPLDITLNTSIDPWFIARLKNIADFRNKVRGSELHTMSKETMLQAKKYGLSDPQVSDRYH